MTPRKEILGIAVPVSAEFVVILAVNFVNQIIVGGLGAATIAAVGFANSITFIPLVVVSALGASLGILVARSYGAGRRDDINATTSVAMFLSVAASFVVAAVLIFSPEAFLSSVGASPTVASIGALYLPIAALSLPFQVGGSVISGLYRSTGYAKIPMWVTFATVTTGALLAFLLVYGIGPFPRMGVTGAAVGLLIGAIAKFVILVFIAYVPLQLVAWHAPWARHGWSTIVSPLLALAVPLAITELFWTLGIFFYNVVFQQISDEALAAAQIAATLEGVFIVASIGLMFAATALIGKSIGAGDAEAARQWTRRVIKAGFVSAVIFGGLYLASIMTLPYLFPEVENDVLVVASIGIVMAALVQTIKVQNMIVGAGVLPSANDVRGVILGDVVGAFVVGLPIAIVLGLFTPLAVFGVFLARIIEEVAKLFIFNWRKNRIDWDKLAREQHVAAV